MMRDIKQGLVHFLAKPIHEGIEAQGFRFIQSLAGLIEHQHGRLFDEGAGQQYQPLFSIGQIGEGPFSQV